MNNSQQKKDGILYKTTASIGKILVLVGLAYLFVGLFFAGDKTQLMIGFFVLIFITLPTVFLFFFKDKFLEKHPKFIGLWKIVRIIYAVSVILYFALWAFGVWHLGEEAKTQKTIDFINSKKITLDDVMGKNLPPVPDQKINDSTITGIDANKNYIRDDVELAIFKKYPNSAKIRAAELQYAQALQLELTQVYSSETLIPVMQKEDSSYFCLGDSTQDRDISSADRMEKEIKAMVLNTDLREKRDSFVFEEYMISYALPSGKGCNIDASSLVN